METLTWQLIKELGSDAILLGGLIYAVRYLWQRNEKLIEKLETSHKEREDSYMKLISENNEKHEECNKRYMEMSMKWQEVVNNNSNVIEKLEDKLSK